MATAAFAQVKLNGALATLPRFVLFAVNCTFVTVPSLSVAEAVIVMVLPGVNGALFVGEVMETAGARFVAMVMLTGAEVWLREFVSTATAVKVHEPTGALLHVRAHGSLVAVPRRFVVA